MRENALAYWIIFKIIFFENNISGVPSECQTIWIQTRPDILSGLVWVQTVCKGYQQTLPAGKELIKCINNTSEMYVQLSGRVKRLLCVCKHVVESGSCGHSLLAGVGSENTCRISVMRPEKSQSNQQICVDPTQRNEIIYSPPRTDTISTWIGLDLVGLNNSLQNRTNPAQAICAYEIGANNSNHGYLKYMFKS